MNIQSFVYGTTWKEETAARHKPGNRQTGWPADLFHDAFIGVVHGIFTDENVHFSVKEQYYSRLEEAFTAAVQRKDPRLKDWLYDLYDFCAYRGFAPFYMRLTEAVEELFPGDKWTLRAVYNYRASILETLGKPAEAMTLHKKQEALCEELGDHTGLAYCYGNQAIILSAWGKPGEAMALHKKQEALCKQSDDRAGLSRCFGNQGLILSDWGRLAEAMTLHKKEEALCEDLNDRAGLAGSYGSQAAIYHLRKEFDQALKLYREQETLYEELGDRAGLAVCWWNQALIHKKKGDLHIQAQLWRKSIETNRALGIPTATEEKALKELGEKMHGK